MSWHLIPKPLQDAQLELDTAQQLWESTEEQLTALIDATIKRIADEHYPFYEDIEDTILQRDQTEEGMRRIARSTTLLQAWAIFEDAARWTAEERKRRGNPVGARRHGETFFAWARREFLPVADAPFIVSFIECLEMLCSLRNAIIHTNGQYTRMDTPTRARVDHVVAGAHGVEVREGRVEVSRGFVRSVLLAVGWALHMLSEPFRLLPGQPPSTYSGSA